MRSTSIEFLAKACKGKVTGPEGACVSGVKIDSRECGPGDLFVCVVGENNNGHNFIASAYEQGCRAFLVSEDVERKDDASYILVKDTQAAAGKMAEAYLAQFDIIKIGITGSVGKTTTRMLTTAVMSAKYKTVCSQKNYNTHLGLCLTSFLADETTECIVFEMGMDRKNELAEYVEWVRPHLVIITNVGISHMERLGSRDAIADAKLEITNKLTEENTLIVNAASDYLKTEEMIRERAVNKTPFKIVSVGRDISFGEIEDVKDQGIKFSIDGVPFELPLLGKHNAVNSCLAAAAGLQYGISLKESSEALKGVVSTERRLKAVKVGKITLLDDSYNASPDSVKAGLSALAGVSAKRRIAMLGDMYELGSAERTGHIEAGLFAADLGTDLVVAAGKNKDLYIKGVAKSEKSATNTIGLDTVAGLKDIALQILRPGDAVLVKGSFGTKISEVAELIRNSEEALS